MIRFKPEDLDFLRRVLRVEKGYHLDELAPAGRSGRLLTVTAITILQGAKVQPIDLRLAGDFGGLLWQLVVAPALPLDGKYQKLPGWCRGITKNGLVQKSLKYGLHKSAEPGGRGLRLEPHPILAGLLAEDVAFPGRCRVWYQSALRAILEN